MPSPKRLKTNAATLRHLGFLKPVINYKRGRGGRRGAICVTMEDHAEAVQCSLEEISISLKVKSNKVVSETGSSTECCSGTTNTDGFNTTR